MSMKQWLPVFEWTLSFLKPYKWRMTAYILLGCGIAAGEMAVPKAIQYLIDDVILGGQTRLLLYLFTSLAILFVVVIIMQAVYQMLERIVTESVSRDIQLTVYRKLRQLGFPYFERKSVGESLSLMNTEVTALQGMYREQLPELLKSALEASIIACLLLWMHAPLALLALPCFVLYYAVGPIMEKKTITAVLRLTETRVELNKKLYDSVSALTELRVHGRQAWDLERIYAKLDSFNHAWAKDHIYSWIRGVPRRIVVYGSALFMFAYGAHLVQEKTLSVGQFAAFAIYYLIMMFRLTVIITCWTEIKLLVAQAEKLYKLTKQSPEVEEAARPERLDGIQGRLDFAEVSFGYPLRPLAVSAFTLHVATGERVAIVGESGSGKTTVLKLIGRFYDPQAGDILLDGIPIRHLSLEQLRGAIGFVFQETYLFGASIRENIRFGRPDATDEEVEAAACAAYIHDMIAQLPNGYDTEVGERGYKLSGGQRQRIAIARMFLKNPAIVVLDEATSALDNVAEKQVQNALDALLHGRTTIAVAHRLSTIQGYDRIAVMEQGRIVEVGSYTELLQARGAFYRLSEGREIAIG